MELFPIRIRFGWRATALLSVAAAGLALWQRIAERRQQSASKEENRSKPTFAKSAVTGGWPEEMNGMPPALAVTPRPTLHRTGTRHH